MFRRLKDIPECLGNIEGVDYEADIPVKITSNTKLRADVIRLLAEDDPRTLSLTGRYRIHKITAYGDVFDVWITNDLGEEEELGAWFFEDDE